MAFYAGAIIGKLKLDTSGFKGSVAAINKGQADMAKKAEKTGSAFKGLGKLIGTGLLAFGGLRVLKGLTTSFMDVATQVENYKVRLEALLGSQKAASDAMDFFQKVAAKVPFTLQEVIEAGTTITAFGADLKKWTPILTDLAAVMGLKLVDAANALGRAYAGGAGAADIFRERGILQIIKDTAKLKHGIEDITKLTLPQFRTIMFDAFTDPDGKIAGAADKLAETWTGMVSMLQDAWFQFRQAVMDAGVFDVLKEQLDGFLGSIDAFKAKGGFEKVGKDTKDFLNILQTGAQIWSDWGGATEAATTLTGLLRPEMGKTKAEMIAYHDRVKKIYEEKKELGLVTQTLEESLAQFGWTVDDVTKKAADWNEEQKIIIDLIDTEIPKIKGIRGETTLWGQDIISVTELVEGLQDTLEDGKTEIPAFRDMSGVLEGAVASFKDIAFVSEDTTSKISIDWEKVSDDISNYWQTGIAEMIAGTESFGDLISNSFNIVSSGIGSTIGGAVKGLLSSIGGLAGPIGSIVAGIATSAISALGSILGLKSEAQKAAEAAAKAAKDLDFWINNIMKATSKYGDISEETAKKIQEADKTMEGFAAVSKYFGDIIKDVGVTQENVNTLWERAVGIVENWHQGHLTAAEAAKAAGESFTLLLEGTRKLGQEGSEAMINFILKTRELGLEVSEVTEYVVNQLDRIPEALEGLLAPAVKAGESLDILKDKLAEQNEELRKLEEEGTKNYKELNEEINNTKASIDEMQKALVGQMQELAGLEEGTEEYIKLESEIKNTHSAIYDANEALREQQEELKGLDEGTQAYINLQEEIKKTEDEINHATAAYEDQEAAVERAGILALATFNAMIDSGASWTDAVDKMKDPLIALRDQYDELGLDANEALDKLFGIIDVTEANEELFEAIDANKTILEALGNSGYLTGELLNGFAEDAIGNYETLKEKFGDSDEALRAMGPTLQNLQDYADAYNVELDEGTQALIDQATELGVVKEKQKSVQEVAKEGFGDMKLILTDIKDVLQDIGDKLKGSGIHQALKDIDTVSKTTWENMKTDVGLAVDKVGTLGSEFDTAFTTAITKAGSLGRKINDEIGAIRPQVDIGFDYRLPDFSNLRGNVDLGFSGGGGFAGGFQHEGTIEAGPYRPTAFVFGEGSQRERATIEHTGKTFRDSGEQGKIVMNNTVTINAQRLDDQTIDEAAEKLFEAIDRQAKRRGRDL